MKSEDILTELKEIGSNDIITKNDLMVILKRYAGIISPYDLMLATALYLHKIITYIMDSI